MGEVAVGRAMRVALAGVCLAGLAACSSTITGTAIKAPQPLGDADAVIALMDTGAYATAAGRPMPAAGDNRMSQGVLEAHRIAEYVVAPWEVDPALHTFSGVMDTALSGPLATAQMIADSGVLERPLADVAAAHGFISGLSTARVTPQQGPTSGGLINAVLRFPDPGAARAAAAEMAAKKTPPAGAPPGPAVPIPDFPGALAQGFEGRDGVRVVQSITAHGPYVLYQSAEAGAAATRPPEVLVSATLALQTKRIDQFVPTPVDKLADLPQDPTGRLMSHTLWAPDGSGTFLMGVWQSRAWLNFEPDPLATGKVFDAAGVDTVVDRLTTVYQAANPEAALRVADELVRQADASPDVAPTEGVPGLPTARCFARTSGKIPAGSPTSWLRLKWAYKCVARADRYAFTAISGDPTDVKQQISAQYRILAGQ